jgi:hypothetical protein
MSLFFRIIVMFLIRQACLISSLALMAACGGGSGVMSVPAPTPVPVTSPQPKSNASADLIAFAQGGQTQNNRFDVLSISRNYKSGTVNYSTVKGADGGLLRLQNLDGSESYRVTAQAKPDIVVGTGGYNGPLDLSYSTTKGGPVKSASGEFNASVAFETNDVAIGGIVGNGDNNIEFFGDAKIRNGRFDDTDTVVRLRDGQGKFIRDYTGTANGIFMNGTKGDAIVGTVASSDLSLKGGYVANEYLGN